MPTFLAQITDLHIREPGRLAYGRLDTAPFFRQAVAAVQRLKQKPHAVVLTGDLVDGGSAAEYAHLAELLAPLQAEVPAFLLPGNHDERDQLRRSFAGGGHAYLPDTEFVQYTVPLGNDGLQLVCLDTVQAGQGAGRLCAKRLRWLEAELERLAGQPVVVAMHHPPFDTLIGHMDELGLTEGAEAFERIVAAHPNIERVICGHLHRTIYAQLGGRLCSTAPSPAHQVCLDLSREAPSAWTLEPPGFHVHAWTAPGRLVTHVAPIGEFAGPFPFHDGEMLAG